MAQTGEPLLARVWDESSGAFLEENGKGYSFDNSGFHLLHLADKKSIDGTLFFRQGRLVLSFASQIESGNPGRQILSRDAARDFSDRPDPKRGEAMKVDERGSPPKFINVNIHLSAAQSDISKAYALNPSRLTSLFACHDARKLIPQLSR